MLPIAPLKLKRAICLQSVDGMPRMVIKQITAVAPTSKLQDEDAKGKGNWPTSLPFLRHPVYKQNGGRTLRWKASMLLITGNNRAFYNHYTTAKPFTTDLQIRSLLRMRRRIFWRTSDFTPVVKRYLLPLSFRNIVATAVFLSRLLFDVATRRRLQ